MKYDILEKCKIGEEVYVYKKIHFKKKKIHGKIIDKKYKKCIRVFEDITNITVIIKLDTGKIVKVKDNYSSTLLDIYSFEECNIDECK